MDVPAWSLGDRPGLDLEVCMDEASDMNEIRQGAGVHVEEKRGKWEHLKAIFRKGNGEGTAIDRGEIRGE